MNLHDWIDELSDTLDIEVEVDEALLADLATAATDNVGRLAAPVTTYLLGFAAAEHGADPERLEALVARAQALAEGWDRPATATGLDDVPDDVPDDSTVDHTGDAYDEATADVEEDLDVAADYHSLDPGLSRMRAVVAEAAGGPEVLVLGERPDPVPGPGELVLDVAAAGLNRADLLQRQGFYPPPPGASDVIGMECSGTVASVGPDVTGWSVGDSGCALLAGGGYAAQVLVPAGQVMPVPAGVDLVTAAALPEVACTVWSNLFMVAGLRPDETLLVHGGAGGIGTFAIQLAARLGCRVFTTAGAEEKRELCRSLGAEVAIDYRDEDFVAVLKDHTDGAGADVILDNMGASYLGRNIEALATEGRLVVIGLQGGTKAEIDLNTLLRKRAALIATTLRSRPTAEKAAICAAVVEHVWPLVADGSVRAIVHRTLPLAEAAAAHTLMESGEHTGKILLTV